MSEQDQNPLRQHAEQAQHMREFAAREGQEMTPREIVAAGLEGTSVKPHPRLDELEKACEVLIVSIRDIRQRGLDSPEQLPDVPMDTTLRHVLEKNMGRVRYLMIDLCERGVTSKAAIHRWADKIKSAFCFPCP